MAQNLYIEDVFLDFYDRCVDLWKVAPGDYRILTDFRDKISEDEPLTQNQGNFLLKLMNKYNSLALANGLDASVALQYATWKKEFRVYDYSKRVFVEKDHNGVLWVCLKFPFAFKNTFDKEHDIIDREYNQWDHDKKIRKLDLYKCNIIKLNEFVTEHGFDIDESFVYAVSQIEEIWNQQDNIVPYIFSKSRNFELINATLETTEFWSRNVTEHYYDNLFLAKSMRLPVKFSNLQQDEIEKICASDHTDFWIKDNQQFFSIYKKINGKVCVLLDRNTQDIVGWLERFVKTADISGVSRSEIKVCFRETESKNSKLNTWIKENNVGGVVKDGRILIFLHKPPKWLFKEEFRATIILTNSFTPISDTLSAAWVAAHHCVCHIGNIKPTRYRNKTIVEL